MHFIRYLYILPRNIFIDKALRSYYFLIIERTSLHISEIWPNPTDHEIKKKKIVLSELTTNIIKITYKVQIIEFES